PRLRTAIMLEQRLEASLSIVNIVEGRSHDIPPAAALAAFAGAPFHLTIREFFSNIRRPESLSNRWCIQAAAEAPRDPGVCLSHRLRGMKQRADRVKED